MAGYPDQFGDFFTPQILDPSWISVPDDFWDSDFFISLGTQEVLKTTHRDAWYGYPETRGQIADVWCAFYGLPRGFTVPQPMPMPTAPPHILMGGDGASDPNPPSPPSPSDLPNPPPPATNAPAPATSEGFDMPAYAPDPSLSSEVACRTYTAYPDPADIKFITIHHDDWQEVKAHRIDEFTRKIYEAVGHAWDENPPADANLRFDDRLRTKYFNQQIKATKELEMKMLNTASKIKAAKAHCQLMVYAAIHVSEVGFCKKTCEEQQTALSGGKVVPREARLDLHSICSVRLEKVVHVVKANKLIAKDILTNCNLNKIAQDPDFYLVDKFKYLASNSVRKGGKRKRSDSVEASTPVHYEYGYGSVDGYDE